MHGFAIGLSLALVVPISLASRGAAGADTIYLVNGRTIHTASAGVQDDRVVFRQFGGTVSIPLSQVLRIVKDNAVEGRVVRSDPTPGEGATVDPVGPASPASDTGPAATASGSGPTPGAGSAAVGGMSTAEYWIDRINQVDARIERVRAELDHLPLYSEADQRLFRFSGQIRYFIAERDKWERLMSGMQLRRRQLVNGARKAGITPGALRDGLKRNR